MLLQLEPIPNVNLCKIAHSKPINKIQLRHDRLAQSSMRVMQTNQAACYVPRAGTEAHESGKLCSGPFQNRADCLEHIDEQQTAIGRDQIGILQRQVT
jgi:hypothetical protein